MTTLQIILLAASAYFAFEIYKHIQTLKDPEIEKNSKKDAKKLEKEKSFIDVDELEQKADRAYEEKNYKEAIHLLKEALKVEKRSSLMAKLAYLLWKYEDDRYEAIAYYKEAIELDKNNEFLYNAVASIYRENREYLSARRYLEESLKINPNNEITYFNYANLLVDMQNIDEAKNMYKKALEINSEFKEAKEEFEKL